MDPTDSINLLLQAARLVEVPGRPEIGMMVWHMACCIVDLQNMVEAGQHMVEAARAEIKDLKSQLHARPFVESPPAPGAAEPTDWSTA